MLPCDCPGQDIFKPEPPRLRRNLSAIVNFAKFREDKALAFQELQVKFTGNAQVVFMSYTQLNTQYCGAGALFAGTTGCSCGVS